MTRLFPILLVLGLGACQPTPPLPGQAPQLQAALRADILQRRDDTAPTDPANGCWAADTLPAVIESVTEQILVEPPQLAPDGSVLRPAIFRSETRQRIVNDRQEVWIRTPCPADQTPAFIASLQRALKARGFYLEPVTGLMDATTAEAIRRYQTLAGLDSPVLALTTARTLGIAAADFGP